MLSMTSVEVDTREPGGTVQFYGLILDAELVLALGLLLGVANKKEGPWSLWRHPP